MPDQFEETLPEEPMGTRSIAYRSAEIALQDGEFLNLTRLGSGEMSIAWTKWEKSKVRKSIVVNLNESSLLRALADMGILPPETI